MKLIETDYSADRLALGDRLLIGNGTFGFRGTLDEHRKAQCAAVTAAGFYDQGTGWRETVNLPNPLYSTLLLEQKPPETVRRHTECLHMDTGTYTRSTVYAVGDAEVTVESSRFFSQTEPGVLYGSYRVSTTTDVAVCIRAGIDLDVWNIHGAHFQVTGRSDAPLGVTCVTNEGRQLSVTLWEKTSHAPTATLCQEDLQGREYCLTITPTQPFTAEKCACLWHDGLPCAGAFPRDPAAAAEENRRWWQQKWADSRVLLDADADLQLAMDNSVYQLLIYAPRLDGISISARGLSGQTYKGAVFWDTEMFMLPFYTATDPDTAERLVRYRIRTLPGALEKARSYGFAGAFYAWESHENGQDACSDFNVTDVFTGRPVRTYFKDKQIHISADVAVAMYRYMQESGRWSLLGEGALEVLYECARFYASYAYYSVRKQRFELLDVIGPDEYHERVNNNAYTNYMALETAEDFLAALERFRQLEPAAHARFVGTHGETIADIRAFAHLLYLPQPNEAGVIEQFDGYFALEDVSVETVRSRLVHPQEYWGGSGGVATATRVIKQADVVTLLCVLPHRFSRTVMEANYAFYLPYTEHGSSLSASMYALCACRIGRPGDAYPWFRKTASTDLTGGGKKYAGRIYIGGTHPAACGGAWMTAVLGFARYGLPPQIRQLEFCTKKEGNEHAESDPV